MHTTKRATSITDTLTRSITDTITDTIQNTKRHVMQGFTLIELVIIMMVMGIVLTMTMRLWRSYTQRVRFQQEKEQFISSFMRYTTFARTSNLAWNAPYKNLIVTIKEDSIFAWTDTNVTVGWYNLEQSTLVVPWNTYTLTMAPYTIGCELQQDPTMKEVELRQKSSVGQGEACYVLTLSTCKLQELSCEE